MSETVRSITRVQGFKDDEMDFQLMRQLGSATYGGSSIGECLSLVGSMISETAEQWVENFINLAKLQELDARTRFKNGHLISAREQFLKASNSYRAAEYYIHVNKKEHREIGLKSRSCFLEYIALTDYCSEVSFLNYDGMKLPYYFVAPDKTRKKRKTIIIISGFDGTMEESFIQSGLSALARGYNVVCFAGPGQMDTGRFNDKNYFIPDFEKPIGKLLDLLLKSELIDSSKLAILGISFGGYFASRVCCYDSRIKALVANSPIVDLKKYVLGFSAYDANDIAPEEDFCYEDIPNIPDEVMPPSLKELTSNLLLRFGNKSMQQTVVYLNEFNIKESMSNINCATLALIGAGEGPEPIRQYKEFLDNVFGDSSFYEFSTHDGADTHCQVANLILSNCVIYDWLDEQF